MQWQNKLGCIFIASFSASLTLVSKEVAYLS
jgi:hypothetical protein